MEVNFFTIMYWFCHTLTWICHGCTCVPHPDLPSHQPPHIISGSSKWTSTKHPVYCIEPRLAICFLHDIIHVSMPFSQIIPPYPSPTESKRLFDTSVSLLLSHIQGYRYHFPIPCIWVSILYCCRRRRHPTPVLLPGKCHGRRSLVGCRLWGREESDTTQAT